MQFVTVRDLRSSSASIWKKLTTEKDMVITSNGRPIALLTKISGESFEESLAMLRRARAMRAVETMQSASRKRGTNRLGLREINAEIQAVRKARQE